MKKIFSAALVSAGILASAQVSFAVKANLIFPTSSASWSNFTNTVSQAYSQSGKNNAGFNVGLSSKIDIPVSSFFVMPEIYFTSFSNKFTDPATNTELQAKNNRIDVPVLLGYKIWGNTLGAFIGPVASYNLSKDDTYNNFKENATKDFTVGFQLGAQAELRKLIVSAKYEGAFTKDERNFVNNTVASNYTVNYDNRPSLFLLGLGYKF